MVLNCVNFAVFVLLFVLVRLCFSFWTFFRVFYIVDHSLHLCEVFCWIDGASNGRNWKRFFIRFCDGTIDGPTNNETVVNATNRWHQGIQSARLCINVPECKMEELYNHTEYTTKIVFQLSTFGSDGNPWGSHQFSTGKRHRTKSIYANTIGKK